MENFITHVFRVLVDETMTIEDAVKAGNFNRSNENITSERFPKPANGQKTEKEVVIFHFNKMMPSEAAIAEMDKAGSIWVLLGLAIKEPDLQREFPIVALGSVCELNGNRYVAYLHKNFVAPRLLYLSCFSDTWLDHCRFVGVRK